MVQDVAIFLTANTTTTTTTTTTSTADGYSMYDQIYRTLQQTFRSKHVTIYNHGPAGYQDGAIAALAEADTNGYFQGYDWVIRLNPDVLILDDTWIVQTITQKRNNESNDPSLL
jgi:hypothetical protein